MKSCTVIIQNSEGLHARPATFFIQKANSYKSTLWIAKDPSQAKLAAEGKLQSGVVDTFVEGDGVRKINAKSLLGVLSLGIAKGDVVTLIADGTDEDEAEDALDHAMIQAEALANEQLTTFINSTITVRDSSAGICARIASIRSPTAVTCRA